MIIRVNGFEPQRPFYMSEDATLIGDVRFGEKCSVWFKTVLRGDIKHIELGNYTNIQDMSVGHVTEELPVILGNYVTVGHGVIMHGCTVNDCTLLGMGATILDNAVIGRGCIIAAGTVIKENSIIPDFSLVAGVPGKIKKTMTPGVIETLKEHAMSYVKYAEDMKNAQIID